MVTITDSLLQHPPRGRPGRHTAASSHSSSMKTAAFLTTPTRPVLEGGRGFVFANDLRDLRDLKQAGEDTRPGGMGQVPQLTIVVDEVRLLGLDDKQVRIRTSSLQIIFPP